MTSCFRSPVFQTGRFSLTGLKNRSTELFFLAPLARFIHGPDVTRSVSEGVVMIRPR